MPNSDPDVFGSSQRDLRKMLTKTPVFPLCEGAPYARCGACPASVRWDCHLAGTEEGWESWLEKGCAQKEKTHEQLILGVWLAWRFLKVLKVFDVWIFCYIATLCFLVSDSSCVAHRNFNYQAFWIPKNYERYRQDRRFMLVLNRFLGEYCRSLLRIPDDGGGMWKGHHECRSFFPSRFHIYVTFSLYTTIFNHYGT